MNNADIDNFTISSKFSCSKIPKFQKYYRQQKGSSNYICVFFFQKVGQYLRRFGKNKCMSFLVSNKQMLKKQNGDKISNKMEKDLIPIQCTTNNLIS